MKADKNKILYIEAGAIVLLLCVISFLLGRLTAPGAGTVSGGKEAGTEATGQENSTAKGVPSPDYPRGNRITQFTKPLDYDSGAVDNTEKKEEPMKAPASYEVVMNTDWNIPKGERTVVNSYVENSRTNSNSVYFTISLDESPGEEIYTSEVLSVGEVLTDITIDRFLPDGDHDGRAVYHILDRHMKEVGTVEMALTLHVGT